MAINNTVKVTLKIRNDVAANWSNNNPVLTQGEFGLENNSFLLKIGDGITPWNSLPYLNKLDTNYFIKSADGTISFNNAFQSILTNVITTSQDNDGGKTIDAASTPMRIDYGVDSLNRPNIPNDGDNLAIVNKYYVDRAIALAGHLKKEIVTTLPTVANADPYTIYMVLDANATGGDKYKEYMLIGNEITQIGDTSVDLKNLVTGTATSGNLIAVAADGSLIDSGISATNINALEPGTTSTLGGVKSSTSPNFIRITNANDTAGAGFMTLNSVSTSLLYVPSGDSLILDGGTSNGGVVSG